LTGVFGGRDGTRRSAFGRAECRFAAGFRREAEASLYLVASGKDNSKGHGKALVWGKVRSWQIYVPNRGDETATNGVPQRFGWGESENRQRQGFGGWDAVRVEKRVAPLLYSPRREPLRSK
jgi:hypothetical protein